MGMGGTTFRLCVVGADSSRMGLRDVVTNAVDHVFLAAALGVRTWNHIGTPITGADSTVTNPNFSYRWAFGSESVSRKDQPPSRPSSAQKRGHHSAADARGPAGQARHPQGRDASVAPSAPCRPNSAEHAHRPREHVRPPAADSASMSASPVFGAHHRPARRVESTHPNAAPAFDRAASAGGFMGRRCASRRSPRSAARRMPTIVADQGERQWVVPIRAAQQGGRGAAIRRRAGRRPAGRLGAFLLTAQRGRL